MYQFIRHWFTVPGMIAPGKRLGDLPRTSPAYQHFMDVAWPATMQGLFLQFMTAIDLAMVGALGADALAAVGIMSQPKMMLLIVVRAIAIAITAMVARRHGEGETESVNQVLKQGLLLTGLAYIPILLLAWWQLTPLLDVAGAQASYVTEAHDYGVWILLALFFNAVGQIVSAGLIGIGKTKMIFTSNAIGNVVNTVLNFFLIYGIWIFPKWGVVGAGIATMFGNLVIMLLLLYTVWRSSSVLSIRSWKGWWITKSHFHTIRSVGGSSLGEQIFERFGMFVYTMMVADLGVVALATHHVCMNLCDIFYYFSMGLGYACASHTGQSLGKKRPDLAEMYGKIGIRIGVVMSAIACAIYIVGRVPAMEIYTSDPAVVQLGANMIILMAIASFPQTGQLVYSGVLKGAGDNYFVMKYSLVVIAVIRPILTYILCFTLGLGLYGAWISLLCDQSLRMICSGWRFKTGYWKHCHI